MSVTDDDQFAAYGGGNYDYLAMGPSSFGFVTMASGNDPNFRVGCSAGGNRMAFLDMPAPAVTMATRSGWQQTLTRATLASSARRCSSRRWPGPQMLCNPVFTGSAAMFPDSLRVSWPACSALQG
jgi:hypothetical protein